MAHSPPSLRRYGIVALWALASCTFFSTALLIRSSDLHADGSPDDVRITILAIGAGSCGVIELPDRRVILIDSGSSSMSDPVGSCIEPFLRRRGIRRIEYLILSHANYDHFGAAFDLLERYHIKHVCLAPQFISDATHNRSAKRLLDTLHTTGPPPRFLIAGQSIPLTPKTRLDVLWPHPDSNVPANESSLVLRLTHADKFVLFTGDIESTAQQHLLDDHSDVRADVLIAPHHGSFESTTGAFVRAVSPRFVVSSNGRSLSQRQRDFDDILTVPHYRTHKFGAITILLSLDGQVQIHPFLHRAME